MTPIINLEFFIRGNKRSLRNEGCEKVGFEPGTPCSVVQLGYGTAAAELTENRWYLCTVLINVYVASPDPDPNPRGGGQLPNPNECNSTLTSGTNNIYPYPYIDVNDRGHRFRSGSPLTNYPHASSLTEFSNNVQTKFIALRTPQLTLALVNDYQLRKVH